MVGSKYTIYFAWNKVKGADVVGSTNHVTLLYIELWPGQTCHSKDVEVAYSIGVGGFG